MASQRRAFFWLLSISLVLAFARTASSACGPNFFDCKNNRCIASFFVCDDDNDCGNFEDELNCFGDAGNSTVFTSIGNSSLSTSPIKCPDEHFACNDSFNSCLPQRWVCDGIPECSNGADEKSCQTNHRLTCGEDFACVSGTECIPSQWHCDGLHDCSDGSDEANCTRFHSIIENCNQDNGYYQCASGECIPYSKRCDGKKDCLLGDDEGLECHINACAGNNCSHLCAYHPTTNTSVCLCPSGFHLQNLTTCVDFDECADNQITNMCSQICINEPGTHRCACDPGYKLVNESHCVVEKGPAILFYSFDDQIRAFELTGNRVSESLVGHPSETITELDIDHRSSVMYFIGSKFGSHGTLYAASFDPMTGHVQEPKAILVHEKLSGLEGVAADSVSGNVYFTDKNANAIIVCKTNPTMCRTLITGRHSPRAILAIPNTARLYWTEWGNAEPALNGIYTSALDGSNITLLVPSLSWPNGLAYDYVRNRIYWTDGHHGSIEYYDLVHRIRHLVFQDPIRQPYSLHVFEDTLYWSDWSTNEIMTQDKITGHNLRPLVFNSRSRFLGLGIYHFLLAHHETSNGLHPCSYKEPLCSHICLVKSPTEYTCSCPDHMSLDNSTRQCTVNTDEPYILATTGRKVYKFYTSEMANGHSEEVPIPGHIMIGDLTSHPATQDLYIFDVRSGSIGLITRLNGLRLRYVPLVTEDVDLVTSLHYEVNSHSLYWIDNILNRVEVFTLRKSLFTPGSNKQHRLTLFDRISKPISLALDSPNRLMYIGARSHPARLYSANLDGTNLRKIMETRKNGVPIAMVKSNRHLVWADPNLAKIEQIRTVGSTAIGVPVILNQRPVGSIHSMDAFNDTVYWTSADSNKIFYARFLNRIPVSNTPFTSSAMKNSQVFTRDLPLTDGLFNTEDLRLIAVDPRSKAVHQDCYNHHCPQLCLIGKNGPACRCENGFSSTDQGITCLPAQKPVIHSAHMNHSQNLEWFLQSFNDIFYRTFNEIPDDDYVSVNGPSENSTIDLQTADSRAEQVTVVKIDNVQPGSRTFIDVEVDNSGKVGPRISAVKLLSYTLLLVVVVFGVVMLLSPDFRRTVINIRLSPDRRQDVTRFFRNPNYEVGVSNEPNSNEVVSFNPWTQTEPKAALEDRNGNLL